MVEFQRFLMALSVRPRRNRAISAQRVPTYQDTAEVEGEHKQNSMHAKA